MNIARFHSFIAIGTIAMITIGFAKTGITIDNLSPGKRGDKLYHAWVYFTDKGSVSEFDRLSAKETLSKRTLKRRSKTRPSKLIDDRDIPVYEIYINQIMHTGIKLRHKSKWLNAVSVSAAFSQLQKIQKYPFVKKITPVLGGIRNEPISVNITIPPNRDPNYGPSFDQLEQINVIAAHDAGYTGEGVLVMMLDTGYYTDHEALHEEQIVAEWDFINSDGDTQNEPGDPSGQHDHGTLTLSTLGGRMDGQLYGPAYEAEFLLAKTEDISQEVPIEEDNYVAALEWGEGLGADVASSSLGYIDWYEFEDLDGLTAVTTIAVNIAIENGMVIATAAGNYSSDGIIAPVDAFDVISCGAVDEYGTITWFSSWGPTADDRIKPEVCARGLSTYCAFPSDTNDYGGANGTSLSTPLIGGTAALILQAHPDWTPQQVREALMMTASDPDNPDNQYGWGIIDVMAAINYEFESDYTGPVWFIATTGSDSTGDGSEENPFATIQHGINSASDDDTVLVATGTYVENINFNGKNIVVTSIEGAENTVIDGNQNGPVVVFESEEDSTTVLSDFTISNGMSLWDYFGGGIRILNSSPVIKNNIIEYNTGDEWYCNGIGIWMINSSTLIKNNIIRNNNDGYWGSGIYMEQSNNVTLSNNKIYDNIGFDGYGVTLGGGVYIDSSQNISLVDNLIINNYGWEGSSLCISSSSCIIVNNTFYGHDWSWNTIRSWNTDIILINCIIWSNGDTQIDASGADTEIIVRYSDIKNGYDGEGNIDADPMFGDLANGDYTLQEGSPCIDAGTAFYVWEGDTLVNMTVDEYIGSAPDMGVFESGFTQPPDDMIYFRVGMHNDPDSSESFIVGTTNLDLIDLCRSQLELPEDERFLHVSGAIDYGNGGFNSPWSWHFIPDEWELAEMSIELCDGNPQYVEDNLEYWIENVGRFCPWSSFIKEELSGEITLEVPHLAGWNLVGLPLEVEDNYYLSVFPDAVEGTIYSFGDGYQLIENVENGVGYWLRFSENNTTTISGLVLDDLQISLTEGWNLISGISTPVDMNNIIDPSGLIIPGTVYGFYEGYLETETLEPGYGYWLRSSGDGEITISSDLTFFGRTISPSHSGRSVLNNTNTLTVGNQTLYFGVDISQDEILSYSLPPKPPAGATDIRFSGDTKICSSDDCLIEFMNDGEPLTIEYDITEKSSNWLLVNSETSEEYKLSSKGVLELPGGSAEYQLTKSPINQLPSTFSMNPAFPNPFNPTTTITFSIPVVETRHALSLQVYDITGRLVETLAHGITAPGTHTVKWDASEFSSGVYFVKMIAGKFVETQKILLLK